MQSSLLSVETRGSLRKKQRLEQGKNLVGGDRLSNLPVFLIDDIVSRLPCRSASFMSILSKKWESLMNTFPGLFFDEQEFAYRNDKVNDRRLCQLMRKYSSCQTPVPIKSIRLGTASRRGNKFNHQVDRCLDLAVPSEIRELVLKLRHSHKRDPALCLCYTIPDKVFSLGKQLSVLELEGCRLGDFGSVNVPLLKRVSLCFVHLKDEQLISLLAACPSLESLRLRHCYDLKRVKICNPSLQRLIVNSCISLESFHVSCPLLQYLECKAAEVSQSRGSILELSEILFSCPALSEIHLAYILLGSKSFKGLFSDSPHVQSVTMISCIVESASNFFPRKLKHLHLEDTYLPQPFDWFDSIESFTSHNSINRYILLPGTMNHVGYGILGFAHMTFSHLKSLSLGGALPPSINPLEFLSFCDRLQNLSLINCHCLAYLKITSETLQTLSVTASNDKQLKGYINAPSLISFKYEGPRIRFVSVTASHELAADLFFTEFHDYIDPLYASNFQHYLDMFKGARVLKVSNLYTECVFTPKATFAAHCLYHLSEMKVTVNLRLSSYKTCLLEVLSMSHCRTSLSLIFEQDFFSPSRDALASLDLKFHDQHQKGVINLQGENNDSIKDHLYEISIQIRKGDAQIISLLKFLLGKALHLKKFVVQFCADVSANNRSSMISRITGQKMASNACEMVIC